LNLVFLLASSLGMGGNELEEEEEDPCTSGEDEMRKACFFIPK
jgi:hypothetical protein